jgi:hypothetical protein
MAPVNAQVVFSTTELDMFNFYTSLRVLVNNDIIVALGQRSSNKIISVIKCFLRVLVSSILGACTFIPTSVSAVNSVGVCRHLTELFRSRKSIPICF